jgi:excisionase family DNA binding protein
MMLVRPRPKPDESVSAYLLRVSESNGYEGVAGLIRLARVPQGPATMHKVLTETGRLPALAETIGRPTAELLNQVYTAEKGVKLPTYAEYRDRKLPLVALRRERACVCPECLQEDSYGRQEWDWALFAACGHHAKLLLDRCPECGESIVRYRMGVSHCGCGFDFRKAETAAVDISPVSFVQTILEGDTTYGDTDRTLRSIMLLASISALWDQLEPDFSRIWAAPVARLHEGLNDACEVLKGGGFRSIVRKIGQLRIARWPELGPRGALLPFLTKQSELEDIWDQAAIDEVGRGLHPASTAHFVAPDDETVRLEGVATILGISGRIVADSVHFGALAPVRGPNVDGYAHWVFRVTDLVGLMRALRKQVPPDSSTEYKMQDITTAAFAHLTKGWGHVLGMIRKGEVSVVAFTETVGAVSLGFQGIVEPMAKAASDQVSVKECAQLIGIYTDAIYRIIKAEVLPATKIGPRFVVKRSDLDEFARSYVFVKELASKLRVNPTNLAEKLMDSGVPAVSGPRVDKGLVYLFRRDDLALIDLQAVAEKGGYLTLTGRKPTERKIQSPRRYLRSADVAKALGVSIQMLSRIERAGLLKRSMVEGHLANTRLYLVRDVQQYIGRFRDNPDLITLDQASAMLDEKPGYFHRKWVRTGRLEAVTDGLSLWYRRSEVEALRMEKRSLLTVSEAAALVRGDNSTIENWKKMGRLKPVSGPKIDGSKWYLYSRNDVEALAHGFACPPSV